MQGVVAMRVSDVLRNKGAGVDTLDPGTRTAELLRRLAEHNIGAEIETIPAKDIDKAYDRVVASDVRYRFVIDAATLTD